MRGPTGQCNQLAVDVWRLLTTLGDAGTNVSLQWVPSYAGIDENEAADRIANEAAAAAQAETPVDLASARGVIRRRISDWAKQRAKGLNPTLLRPLATTTSTDGRQPLSPSSEWGARRSPGMSRTTSAWRRTTSARPAATRTARNTSWRSVRRTTSPEAGSGGPSPGSPNRVTPRLSSARRGSSGLARPGGGAQQSFAREPHPVSPLAESGPQPARQVVGDQVSFQHSSAHEPHPVSPLAESGPQPARRVVGDQVSLGVVS